MPECHLNPEERSSLLQGPPRGQSLDGRPHVLMISSWSSGREVYQVYQLTWTRIIWHLTSWPRGGVLADLPCTCPRHDAIPNHRCSSIARLLTWSFRAVLRKCRSKGEQPPTAPDSEFFSEGETMRSGTAVTDGTAKATAPVSPWKAAWLQSESTRLAIPSGNLT